MFNVDTWDEVLARLSGHGQILKEKLRSLA